MKTVAFIAFALLAPIGAAAASPSEHTASFDPAKGFRPAQRDLTEIFLQLAASLENYGSPEPYVRHVAAEHNRIEALYRAKYGKPSKSYRPEYLTDGYVDRLSANWKLLAPKLGLESYAMEVGHLMRDAIKGTRGTGTIIVDIFNRHQARVFDRMTGNGKQPSDFESLRVELESQLELNKTSVSEERYEIARRDAVSYAIIIHGTTKKLFAKLDQTLKPAVAERVKTVLNSIIMDTGVMAQSELEAGIAEWAIDKPSTAAR